MRQVTTIALFVLLSISLWALPQAPIAATTGSIEGIVVRSDNGALVAGARVTLMFSPFAGMPAGQWPLNQTVVTAGDGKFTFKDVAAFGYSLSGTADGFVRQEVGQRAVNGQGRPVLVTANQVLKDVVIRLIPTGIVSGRVLDENGQPATGAPVQLLRSVYNAQGRSLQVAGNAVADDRGEYRAFGVLPGRYYLLAGTPPRPGVRGRGGSVGDVRFSQLYYPSAETSIRL
jgi:hypothetical protein